MISNKIKNVGVLGRGKWGKMVISNLKNISNIKFVYGKNFKFNNIDKDIEWVFILTPNSTHFKLAKLFLEKNYNVFCEKPLCINYKKSLKLYNLAKIKKKNYTQMMLKFTKIKKLKLKKTT